MIAPETLTKHGLREFDQLERQPEVLAGRRKMRSAHDLILGVHPHHRITREQVALVVGPEGAETSRRKR